MQALPAMTQMAALPVVNDAPSKESLPEIQNEESADVRLDKSNINALPKKKMVQTTLAQTNEKGKEKTKQKDTARKESDMLSAGQRIADSMPKKQPVKEEEKKPDPIVVPEQQSLVQQVQSIEAGASTEDQASMKEVASMMEDQDITQD